MQEYNAVQSYLDTVGEQIRWKRARKPLQEELQTHINDCRDRLVEEGMDEKTAEQAAVKQMGDPVDVGVQLDRVHRPRPNWTLIICALLCLAFGITLLTAMGGNGEYIRNMLICAGIGSVFLVVGYFCDYTIMGRFPEAVFITLSALCIIMPHLGNMFFSTATELCYALPVAFAMLVYKRARGGRIKDMLMLYGAGAVCLFAAFMSVSFTSLLVYNTIVCCTVLAYAAFKGWFDIPKSKARMLGILPAAAIIFMILFMALFVYSDGIGRRLGAVLHPESDPYGMGFIPTCVRELLDGAVFFGTGDSSAFTFPDLVKWNGYDIYSVNYMLAYVTHKFGRFVWVVLLALITAVAAAVIAGVKKQSCRLGSMVVLSIGLCFGVRVLFYIVNNLGFTLLSLEGIPFFSYCGKLMIIDMFLFGLLLSVFRTGSISRDIPPEAARHVGFITVER